MNEPQGSEPARDWRATGRRIVVRIATAAVVMAMLLTEAWGAVRPDIESAPLAILGFAHIFFASFWHYLGFAALLCLLLSALLRMKWTAIIATLALAAGLGPWAFSFLNGPRAPDPARPELTILSANLLYTRDDLSGLIEQVAQLDPDIILLQEVHPDHERPLTDALRGWEHRAMVSQRDPFGQAIFSRLPFIEPPSPYPTGVTTPPDGWPPQMHCRVRFGGQEIDVVNVHTYPPGGVRMMIAQDRMARGLAELASGSDAEALLMAGDFNSAERGQPVRRVRGAGLRSVHAVRGRGLGATWPRVSRLKHLPGTRLDQVLYRGLELVRCGVGEDFGSDHRPVFAVFQAPAREAD